MILTDTVLLHLSLIAGAGPATVEKLVLALEKKGGVSDLTALYAFTEKDFAYYAGIKPALAQQLISGLSDKKLLEQELVLLEKHKISWISYRSNEYPQLLKTIHLPPLILYVQGHLPVHDHMIAVVGSRKADAYGARVVKMLVDPLVHQQWTIVSGGALGIDTLAHQATLNARGTTVACIGSGLLKPYPEINKKLFTAIIESGGAVISPFALTMGALPGNFPARNRIIAGLSRACIVAQAAVQSGALITARFALEQGREVGAVPGPIDNPLSAGSHKLIAQGAHMITCAEDIGAVLQDTGHAYTQQVLSFSSRASAPASVQEEKPLSIIYKQILALVQIPCSFDELLAKSALEHTSLQDILWDLQLEGHIEQNFMGLWVSGGLK